MEIVVSAPSGRLGPERWNGDNSEVLSVRGQLLVLDADAPSDRAASLGLERAQLGLERRQALGRDVVGRTRRPWLSGCG